jgi:hypothetical protein
MIPGNHICIRLSNEGSHSFCHLLVKQIQQRCITEEMWASDGSMRKNLFHQYKVFTFQLKVLLVDTKFLGAKKRLYKRLRPSVGRSVGPSVGWSVRPHITSKTSYIAIASRRGGGRGKLVTSLLLRA